MTYSQCGHFDFKTMTDEQIKASCKMIRGETEFHGPVTMACCEKCYEMVSPKLTQFSIEGSVKE